MHNTSSSLTKNACDVVAQQASNTLEKCGDTTLADDFPWHRIRRMQRK